MEQNSHATADRLLVTKRDASRLLSISDRYLDALIRRADVPVIRFGRAVRIPREAIERLAREGSGRAAGAAAS